MTILFTCISKDPQNLIFEYPEDEYDINEISKLALEDIKKGKQIYREVGK